MEPVTIFISRNVFIFRKQSKVFNCDIYGILTTRRDNINRHMRRKHDATYKDGLKDEKALSARIICSDPNCNEEYFHKSEYIEHLSKKQHADFQTIEENFTNMQEFFSWNEKEESENFLCFSKQRGTSSSEIASNMYYVCQHDGHSKAHRRKEDTLRETHYVLLE